MQQKIHAHSLATDSSRPPKIRPKPACPKTLFPLYTYIPKHFPNTKLPCLQRSTKLFQTDSNTFKHTQHVHNVHKYNGKTKSKKTSTRIKAFFGCLSKRAQDVRDAGTTCERHLRPAKCKQGSRRPPGAHGCTVRWGRFAVVYCLFVGMCPAILSHSSCK
jgi:hypothetical protein